MTTESAPIFIWRDHISRNANVSKCPWCSSDVTILVGQEDGSFKDADSPKSANSSRRTHCRLCGWSCSRHVFYMKTMGIYTGTYKMSILREFADVEDANLAAEEACSRLNQAFSESGEFSWAAILKETESVFGEHGFRCKFARTSNDERGCVLLVTNDEEVSCLQLKRPSSDKTVAVEFATALLGFGLHFDRTCANIVVATPSEDLQDCELNSLGVSGLEFDLAAADEFARCLGVISEIMPALSELSAADRAAIVASWRPSQD